MPGRSGALLALGDTKSARAKFQQSYTIFAAQTQPGPGAVRAKMAMLTATEDSEGWFDAPHELKEQFVSTLVDRLHGPPATQVGFKSAKLEFQASPTRLRYRIGTKPKPSAAGKELERVLHVYKLQSEVDTRAKRASSELHRVETALRKLDKLQPESELTLTPFERDLFKRRMSDILTALAKMEK